MHDDMVGRVAMALADCALEPFDELSRAKYMGDARAAIAAMREPTEAMIVQGADGGGGEHITAWRAMIDAALQTKMAVPSPPEPTTVAKGGVPKFT